MNVRLSIILISSGFGRRFVRGLSTSATTVRKSLGRTSYVRQQNLEDAAKKSFASPATLIDLAKKNEFRKPGSIRYNKSWRNWSTLTIEAIRYQLSLNLPIPVNRQGFEELMFKLGVAADIGEMPSFSDAGSRAGYAIDFFCRARMLGDLLVDTENPSLPEHWKGVLQEKRLLHALRGESATCTMTSLGGGPGFDFVAAAMASFYNSAWSERSEVHATILDYEEGWEDLVDSMSIATSAALPLSGVSCRWGGKCDITKPLDHFHNAACLNSLQSTDLWTCQYCVSENAKELRETNYVFFRELFQAVPVGTLFLFTETTPRLWPDFYDLVQNELPYMEISFPRISGRSNKGNQLALIKRHEPSPVRESDLVLVEEFRRRAQSHEQKLLSGWQRQSRKIRGTK